MAGWRVERVVHFGAGELVKDGFVHFGFHDKHGKQYLLAHQSHFVGLVRGREGLTWTVAADRVYKGVPNIQAEVNFPIYIDTKPDGTLLISNFGDGRVFKVDPVRRNSSLFVDGPSLGIKHAGNCVVDSEGCTWMNEVDGCRVWKFDPEGKPLLILGDGKPGFQSGSAGFDEVRFNWIYDLRIGPSGKVYVLDSRNFALRVIDPKERKVTTVAGTGVGGYHGDGGPAERATFGSDPSARFDGPISLSLDEWENVFVGDRFNHVVRMIRHDTQTVQTIAGTGGADVTRSNHEDEIDPLGLNLPEISSMDYFDGRLFVPTDLSPDSGDLAVLVRSPA